MEIITKTFTETNLSSVKLSIFSEDSLFFDIECVGLSPKKSQIYLIGCGSRKGEILTITLFFANSLSDERELLDAFDAYLNDYSQVISFNGTRFDEPFIVERMKHYGLVSSLPSKNHLDLYLCAVKSKCILNLENFKQKTIESFLGIYREDTFNGGELIPIYKEYEKTKDEELKRFLLLHNFEDVRGMVDVLEITAYGMFIESDLRLKSLENGKEKVEAIFESEVTLPSPVNKQRDFGLLILKDNHALVALNKVHCQLYYYIPNYRDYVYLINEDMVIPKQLSSSIDSSAKSKATKENCRVKAEDDFVEIPSHLLLPKEVMIFKADYHDKRCFIKASDVTDEVLKNLLIYIYKH